MLTPEEIVLAAEKIEIAGMQALCQPCGEHLIDGHVYYHLFSSREMAIVSPADVLFVNRVLGVGLEEAITAHSLTDIKTFFQRFNRKRFFIQVSPLAMHPDTHQLLLNAGGAHRSNWVKLAKVPEKQEVLNNDIQVRLAKPSDYETMANILIQSFAWPAELKTFCLNAFGGPGWTHYVALLDNKVVGTGSLFSQGMYAVLAIAATEPAARKKGVQTALIQTRENQAFQQGCRYLFVETAEPTAENPAPSYRNMIRKGFQECYRRPNYLFTL